MADGQVIAGGVSQLPGTNGGVIAPEGYDPNPQPEEEDVPMLDININNVVCSFNTKCHLNLKRIAMEGTNVEYHRQHGMLNMRLRNPYTTASVWSSGKITCTGALSEEFSKIAARKFARKIQKMGYKVKFTNFRIVNVLGTCSLPFALDITKFSMEHKEASYEPELHPGVTYRIKSPKATLKIFSTGSITVTAPRVANVQSAIEYIYPLVADFNAGPRSVKTSSSVNNVMNKRLQAERKVVDDESDFDGSSMEDSDGDFDSDVSQD
ncbi:TATA box-binding protein-like 1 [Ruditapes philippinarum]|uniref:TATA box-binding protein-like 1 n=1 Tax=Ruditapes philippinarum TaxID=129788 RepID=UPI00295BF142|nr:TATA box-binding protein-like 1 [Ruditapes philippinarum]XP_060558148.1 TATA box-binding protein-like 1 [Ruditapes philippinarum]